MDSRVPADFSRRCEKRDRAAQLADRLAHAFVLAVVLLVIWRFV